jgi:rfaE bifunctional protein kinase chain/domain
MKKLSSSRLKELIDNFKNKRVAVLGDLMLDSYMWGTVRRISPEAPVPVVEVDSETVKLGGAANVANNIINLGAEVVPIGVVGKDSSGDQIRSLFEEIGVNTESIITDPDRPTTIKTRIIAHGQHVVRADIESKSDISRNVEDQLLTSFSNRLQNIDGVILQDYNKGVITSRIIKEVVKFCVQREVFTAVDPKFNNFFEFKEVDLLKPNRRETEEALGIKIYTDEDLKDAAQTLFERLRCNNIMITLGGSGMTLFPGPDQPPIHVPTNAAKIHDVSGAGDTVISTLVVSKVAGASLEEAMTLANYAAGIVCGEVGVVPIEHDRLAQEISKEII